MRTDRLVQPIRYSSLDLRHEKDLIICVLKVFLEVMKGLHPGNIRGKV